MAMRVRKTRVPEPTESRFTVTASTKGKLLVKEGGQEYSISNAEEAAAAGCGVGWAYVQLVLGLAEL